MSDDWIEIGNRHEITVSNLRPGRYVFRVKGSNNHGVWNETGAALAIEMRPPWWQSWWFRVLASFSCCMLSSLGTTAVRGAWRHGSEPRWPWRNILKNTRYRSGKKRSSICC
ncbi:MAG: hypothetical protein KJ808_10110 [Acidobacteria bacterium]|nr:hypothetical protein [Acidobacteriota bacterium]MBU4307755.1 hypothetical protein [Acidobacteriota bacterium]MBU4404002.1 hypothetical protein [Acidobacteriota bacterium]